MPRTKGRTLARLIVPMSIKAVTDANGVHTFEGLAATWQKDLGNDVIARGAFKKWLTEWKASGDSLPLLNSHDAYDIFSSIGQLMDAQETKEGFWTKWALLPGAEGDAVHVRITPHPLTGKSTVAKMSIGYEPVKFSYEQPEGTTSFWDQIRHLEEVNLKEVSLVLFPMNEGAAVDSSTVKQFALQIKSSDGASLDGLTRHQLRELNGRIGNLLKKHKGDESTEETEPKTPVVKGKKDSSTSTSTPSTETPSDEEAEDLDIAREILDEEDAEAQKTRKKSTPAIEDETDEEDDESESSSDDSDDPEESRELTDVESAEEQEPVKTYMFSEALQQRLRGLKIKRIASGLAREEEESE